MEIYLIMVLSFFTLNALQFVLYMYTMAIFILDADNPIPCVDLEEPGLATGMGNERINPFASMHMRRN